MNPRLLRSLSLCGNIDMASNQSHLLRHLLNYVNQVSTPQPIVKFVTFIDVQRLCPVNDENQETRSVCRSKKDRLFCVRRMCIESVLCVLNCWFTIDFTQYRRYLDLPSIMVGTFHKPPSICILGLILHQIPII